MKIFCIGRNYADHARELKNDLPTEPLVFMKPPTALLRENKPFFIPEFTKNCHYEGEIVLRIAKNGRHIEPKFAHKYIDAIAFGIDWTARDVQDRLKAKGQPWELAKAFDHSATLSEFMPSADLDLKNLKFQLKKNGEIVQDGNTKDVIFDFETIICYISKFFTLVKGDYIFTGTPAGVGPANPGDVLEGYIEGKKMLRCEVK
jgi:2-keto-4-pentenoate hydratase/2-oxohepta-3-ene-1,7-dioic acid hydratase in catechol pathway